MLNMDTIAEIRRRHLVSRESIGSIARDMKLSRPTVRKHCRTQREPAYRRARQPMPKLGAFQEILEKWLRTERLLPKAQRRTARRLSGRARRRGADRTFTIRKIAAKQKINVSYVSRVPRLTLLEPEIVEAILDGRQAPEMTLPMLMAAFPAEWDHQNRLIQNNADPAGAPSSPRPPRRGGSRNKPIDSSKEMLNVR